MLLNRDLTSFKIRPCGFVIFWLRPPTCTHLEKRQREAIQTLANQSPEVMRLHRRMQHSCTPMPIVRFSVVS